MSGCDGNSRNGGGEGHGDKAAHRADGAAARWGHRALPQRDTSVERGDGAAARGVRTRGAGCQAAHRGGEPPRAMWRGGASREARRPSIAPYRNGTRVWGARGAGRRGAGVSAVPGERRFALFGRLDSGARDRFRINGVRLWRARTFRSRQSGGAFFRCRRDRHEPERGMRGTQPHWCWRLSACFGRVKRERKRG